MRALWGVLCIVATACGGGAAKPDAMIDAAPDSAFGAPSDVYPAFRPPVPQITKQSNAFLLTQPRVLEVFFSDDTETAMLEDFTTKLATSPEWTAMVQEYGIGPITVATPVVLTTPTPMAMTDTEIRGLMQTSLDGTHPEWGPTDAATLASTIYVFHMPLGVQYSQGSAKGCTDYYGYHFDTMVNNTPTPYAIINSCVPPSIVPTTFDLDTATITHELVEAVTDPRPFSGYNGISNSFGAWAFNGGSELGDMCETNANSFEKVSDLGYTIQRTWSNAGAAGYHEFCVPAPSTETVFIAAAPVQGDSIVAQRNGAQFPMIGTAAHLNQPVTISVDLFSDGPTGGKWAVEALDTATLQGATATPLLDLHLDRALGENGEIVHLTITPKSMPASGVAFFTMRSTLPGIRIDWPGAVGVSP